MKSMKKVQLVTLVITVVILVAVGTGIYILAGGRTNIPDENLAGETVTASVEDKMEEMPSMEEKPSTEEDKGEENKSQGSSDEEGTGSMFVNDDFVLLEGGSFVMGSPDSERQRGTKYPMSLWSVLFI